MTLIPFKLFRSRPWIVVCLLLAPAGALAQDAPQPPPEARETGLPPQVDWTFNLDASWGTFGFANSLYQNPKEDVDEELSDQWFEGAVKPALSARYTLAGTSEFYGKVSVVGERTYGSVPEAFGADISSFGPEDAFVGWRSGGSVGSSENLLDVSVGREQYRLGHGMLLWDGSAEGGSRGGYWTNARKAFEFATVARVKPGPHTGEIFYLDKDELDEADSGTRTWGLNYELALGPSTVGATYLHWMAHEDARPERNGLDVFNVRAYASPLTSLPGLSVEVEYASERNGDALDSNAWTAQGSYELDAVAWKPRLSYRYAFFQGDNPETTPNEAFDPLLPGFYDWGSWWQGEIAGEYFVSNSNLSSHLIRAHLSPTDAIGTGLMFFKFGVDQPASYGDGVTDSDLAFEMDAYLDWKVNRVFTVSVVGAFANPQSAAQQAFDRTKNFGYGMVFFAYSY
jgi:hypothetical protein